MSERGREILSTADIIAAEDTRRSVVLLNKLGIRGNSLSANHKFNEYGKAKWFIEQLASGKDIAVITDAGTPCISDPGNELIRAAVENGIRVVGVPGCCAAVNALSISGFDLSTFFFYGFFPRETADRRRVLMMMRKGDTATYAFYESHKRIMSVIDFFIEENAQLRLCLCNDMTKLHEMTFRGTPQEVKDQLIAKETYEKGEYALIVEVCDDYRLREVEHITSPEALLVDCMVRSDCHNQTPSKQCFSGQERVTYSKNRLYAAHPCAQRRVWRMSIVVSDLSERLDTLTKLVLAEPVARIGHSRVTVRPLTLRGKVFFQLEYQQGQKVAHRNVARGALLETFEQELDGLFRSVTLCTETETRQYVRKTNGAYKCTAKSGAARAAVTASHNRKKEYIFAGGREHPRPRRPRRIYAGLQDRQGEVRQI